MICCNHCDRLYVETDSSSILSACYGVAGLLESAETGDPDDTGTEDTGSDHMSAALGLEDRTPARSR